MTAPERPADHRLIVALEVWKSAEGDVVRWVSHKDGRLILPEDHEACGLVARALDVVFKAALKGSEPAKHSGPTEDAIFLRSLGIAP